MRDDATPHRADRRCPQRRRRRRKRRRPAVRDASIPRGAGEARSRRRRDARRRLRTCPIACRGRGSRRARKRRSAQPTKCGPASARCRMRSSASRAKPIEEIAMNPGTAKSVVALALLAAAGCATVSVNDPDVADARAAVYAARSDPRVTTYAPLELDQAVITMNRVDQLVRDAGNVDEVHHLAYLARQRAALAQETARIKAAEAAVAAANAERQRVELAARAREAEAAKQSARDAQYQAEMSRRQAEAARDQAASAQ